MIRSAVIVEGYGLDLQQDIATDFTYSIQDIREPDKRRTDFSKTIDIPGTPRNNALFAHIFDINVENDYNPALSNIGYNYNPNKAAKAMVLVDGIEVFRGVIRILTITNDQGVVTYETNVMGRLADILFAMGDKKLADIDFSDMDHTLNIGQLESVWNNPTGYRYTYPLIDYGVTTDGVNYPISNFAPAIYAKEYVDRMFASAGFTYTSDFFNTPYFQSLVIPNTTKKEFTWTPGALGRPYILEYYSTQRDDHTKYDWKQWYNVWWGKRTDPFGFVNFTGHDNDSNFIRFTRDIETSVQFNFHFYVSSPQARIYVILNGQVVQAQQVSGAFDHFETVIVTKRQFSAGDILILSMDVPPRASKSFKGDTAVYMPALNDTSAYPIDDQADIVMSDCVSKDIAQKDFFKSLILMHNLYVFTDPDNDKNLFVIPQAWFYNTYAGDGVDWTYKVDYSKPIEIVPMGELTAREFLFTYKKDSDYWNDDRYFKVYNEVYGQKQFTADTDFETESQNIEVIFSPTPSVQATTNTRVIPHVYKVDSQGVKQRDIFNIRILQYGGMLPSYQPNGADYAQWKVTDFSGNVLGTYINYPYAGMMDNPTSQYFSRDLCFGPPRELFFQWNDTTGFPDKGLYRFYWEGFIKEITNKDSKLWRGYVLLTPVDISQLDFKRLVKIDNTYFKLNLINQYNPMANDVTRVELFKTAIQVDIVKPGFLKWSDEGYLLHSDEAPARIPYA